MERNTQLHGASLVLWTTRIPSPWQQVQDAFASPIAVDRFHCILRMSSWRRPLRIRRQPLVFNSFFHCISTYENVKQFKFIKSEVLKRYLLTVRHVYLRFVRYLRAITGLTMNPDKLIYF